VIETDGPAPGAIMRAVVDRPIKGQGGVFLKTPEGNAFLRQVKGLSPGQTMLVQVSGYAEAGKAIPVTDRILFKSRYVIVTPNAPGLNISRSINDDERRDALIQLIREEIGEFGHGMILRSSCADAEGDEIVEDAQAMLDLASQVMADDAGDIEMLMDADSPHQFAWREWTQSADVDEDDGCFATHDILDQIEALSEPLIKMADGHYYIEPTRACITIDVNTGADTSPAAALKANIAMARDLGRQLRMRGLGGQIVIDPAPIPKKDRKILESAIKAALRKDTVETNFVGFTQMGLIELQRARVRPSWIK
jgi:ribonuclease G